MKYTENALNILTVLEKYKGAGKDWVVKNQNHMNDVGKIVEQLNKLSSSKEKPTSVNEFENLKSDFQMELDDPDALPYCDGITALGDEDFPEHRGNVTKGGERPVLLFYKGEIHQLGKDSSNIAVIGLLNPTETIEDRERKIVSAFVDQGAVIVSGLAFGCDSIAHHQALESEGKTVAILPSPLNWILPERNKALAHRIVEEGGLLVTEYKDNFKDTRELSGRYVRRDRLQALFSDAVVLAASYAKDSAERWPDLTGKKLDSGARHAMGFAEEYGIPQFVMYNEDTDVGDPKFDLNREVYKKGATILTRGNISGLVERVKNRREGKKEKGKDPVQRELFD